MTGGGRGGKEAEIIGGKGRVFFSLGERTLWRGGKIGCHKGGVGEGEGVLFAERSKGANRPEKDEKRSPA